MFSLPIKTLIEMLLLDGIIIAISLGFIFYISKNIKLSIIIFSLLAILSYIPLTLTIPYFQSDSTKVIAKYLKSYLRSHPATIVCYGHYFQDLPVYLNQSVKIVDWKNELRFGSAHQKNHGRWMWSKKHFFKVWQSDQPVFMLIEKDDFSTLRNQYREKYFYVIKSFQGGYLVTNHPAIIPHRYLYSTSKSTR